MKGLGAGLCRGHDGGLAPARPAARRRLRLALLASCLAMAAPALLAAPHYSGEAGWQEDGWLGHGWQVAAPAYAQSAPDDVLNVDKLYDPLIIGPNQISITWNKSAVASASDYMVYASRLDGDGYQHDALRNVARVDGSGTTVHTLTFDGPGLGKDSGEWQYNEVIAGGTWASVFIGNVTNGTGATWAGYDSDWNDPDWQWGFEYLPDDGQRPAVSSAKLTGQNNTITVTYDEPVQYRQMADYKVVLDNGSSVNVVAVFDGDSVVLGANETSRVHELRLNEPVDLDGITHLSIAAQNITDSADYVVNGTSTSNSLLNETVAVTEGFPPRPLSAAITGSAEITVTFDEPVNSSPANYPDLDIWLDDYISPSVPSRTVAEVAGNGTATHRLTLSMPDTPIPRLLAAGGAAGWIAVSGVSDTGGTAMSSGQSATVPLADERTSDGVPQLVAARFTGPNEVTVSYDDPAAVPAGGYSLWAEWESLRTATPGPNVTNYELNYTHTLPDGTTARPALNYSIVDVASVSGNGTAVHRLALGGGGVTDAATGLINITGLAAPDGTPVGAPYLDAAVYDGQMMRVSSAWWNAGTDTVFVEYGEPALGPLSAYRGATVRGYDGSGNLGSETRGVESVTIGNLAAMRDSPRLIGAELAGDQEFFTRAARLLHNTLTNWELAEGGVAGGNIAWGNDTVKYTGRVINSTSVNGTVVAGTLVKDSIISGSVVAGSFTANVTGANVDVDTFVGNVYVTGTKYANGTTFDSDVYVTGEIALVNSSDAFISDVAITGTNITGAALSRDDDINDDGEWVVRFYEGDTAPAPQSNVARINGTFTVSRIAFDRPTPETVIVREEPAVLNRSSILGGYTGQLVLPSGNTVDVRVEQGTAWIDGYYETSQSAGAPEGARPPMVPASFVVDDASVWLVTPVGQSFPGSAKRAQLHDPVVYYDPKEAVVPEAGRPALDGLAYFAPYGIETASGCMQPVHGAVPWEGCGGRSAIGPVHMVTLDAPAPGSQLLVDRTFAGALVVGANVSGTNANPVEGIGASYRSPGGEAYYWQVPDRQVPGRDATTVNFSARALADFATDRLADFGKYRPLDRSSDYTTDRPLGLAVPRSNPSFHVNDNDIVLQMRFNEPVDAQSIDPSRVKITLEDLYVIGKDRINPAEPGNHSYRFLPNPNDDRLYFPLQEPFEGGNAGVGVVAVSDRLVTIKVADRTWKLRGYLSLEDARDNIRTNEHRVPIQLSDILETQMRGPQGAAFTAKVTLEPGFASSESGRPLGSGTYYAWTSPLPAPAAVASIAVTGNNTFAVFYSDPLHASYRNLVLEPGGNRSVIDVTGNGTKRHSVTFDGVPVPSTAGGTVTILGVDTTAGTPTKWRLPNGTLVETRYVNGTLSNGTVVTNAYPVGSPDRPGTAYRNVTETPNGNVTTWVFPNGNVTAGAVPFGARVVDYSDSVGTGYVPGVPDQTIRPLDPDRAAREGSGAVSVKSAAIRPGNSLTVVYTGALAAWQGNYSGLLLQPGGPRNVTGVDGSGTDSHTVTFDGDPATGMTEAAINVTALNGPGGFARFAGVQGLSVAQPPSVPDTAPARTAAIVQGSLATNGTHLTVVYTNPVHAAASDYRITARDGAAIEVTGLAGNGTASHTVAHTPVPGGTLMSVSISQLDDAGSGYAYAGTASPITVQSPFAEQAARPDAAAIVPGSLATNGTHLTVNYTNPVHAAAADYRITALDGAAIEVTGLAGNGTASHTVAHAPVPGGTWLRVSVSQLDDVGSGYAYAGTTTPIAVNVVRDSVPIAISPGSYNATVAGERGAGFYIGRFGTGPLDQGDPVNNTITLPPARNVTVRAGFAEITFPPNVTARSVPGDGLIEVYVANYTNASAVAAALGVAYNDSVKLGQVVEVGDEDVHIWFDKPVRILLANQSGGLAFYVNNTDDRVVPINATCALGEAGLGLNGTGECQIDAGNGVDKVIHTHHFTLFGTLNPSPGAARTPDNGTGPGNGTGPASKYQNTTNGKLSMTIMPKVVVPLTPTGPGGTGGPGALLFPGGPGGSGGGGGGGGGGARLVGGQGALVLYSASWDCDEGTIRMAFGGASQGAEISVVSSGGPVAAEVAEVQGRAGLTVYEAPLPPTDTTIGIRALSVEGRAVSSVSETLRTGGECTGEAVFAQYAGAAPTGSAAPADGEAADGTGQPMQEAPARADAERPRDAPAAGDDGPAAQDGVRPDAERPAFEIEEGRDASYYVKRYAEQPAYREWFDTFYPQYADICEAVGVAEGCVEAHLAAAGVAPAGTGAADDAAGVAPPPGAPAAPDDDDSGCLIATAAYGTELAPQVQALREYRDTTLLASGHGSAFMSSFSAAYYAFSPHVADLEREHPAVRQAVAALIAPMLYSLQVATQADPASEASVVAHGIAAILLVAGMYVGAPAAVAAGAAGIARRRRAARAALS